MCVKIKQRTPTLYQITLSLIEEMNLMEQLQDHSTSARNQETHQRKLRWAGDHKLRSMSSVCTTTLLLIHHLLTKVNISYPTPK